MKTAAPPHKIRIMLVEDHVLVRVGLACVVNAESDMEIVAEIGDGKKAAENCKKHSPDVVVLDLRMPGVDGIEVMRTLQHEFGGIKCLILSSYDGGDEITRAMQQGASGYVLKGMASDQLLDAIRTVHAGGRYIPPEIADRMKERVFSDLSAREMDILRLIAKGRSNKEVASDLGIVEGTVKGHVTNILIKLGAMDRTQAIASAVKRGIINFE